MTARDAALAGKVALVAGATHGAGRGTAVALGEAGAVVYCTGRSTRNRPSDYARPETIEETAALVTAAGGRGVAVAADHLQPAEVEALVQQIDADEGRLDILVNDIWGGERRIEWNAPVWNHGLDSGLRMLHTGVDTHLITSHFALPLLIRAARRAGRGDDRRDARLQCGALPRVGVLRPRQECRSPPRLQPGGGTEALRMLRRGPHSRLDALGDDARSVRRHGGHLARCRRRPAALRRDFGEPALRRACRGCPRCRPGRARAQRRLLLLGRPGPRLRASRTSMAPGPTAGGIWWKSRKPAFRRTRPVTAS